MLTIAIEELPKLIKLAHKSHTNVLVVGDPGVGKSFVIEGMKSDTCRTFSMTGSSTIEEYVNGIPQVGTSKQGYKQLEYVPSEWLVDTVMYGKEHPDHMQVMFLDEFNTADPQVLKTFLTILSERRVPTCEISLPDNVVIVAAMNPQDQNEGEPLIRPLVSRFLVVKVASSIDQYRSYIKGSPVTITHCDFDLLDKPEELSIDDKNYMISCISSKEWGVFEDGNYHEINPRSCDNFFRALSWCKNKKECAPLLSAAFLGIKLSMPTKTKGKTAADIKAGTHLNKDQISSLSDPDLKEYAVLIGKEPGNTIETRQTRLAVKLELEKRGLPHDASSIMGGK